MGLLRPSRRRRPFRLSSSQLVPVLLVVSLALFSVVSALLLLLLPLSCSICPHRRCHSFPNLVVTQVSDMMRDILPAGGLLPLLLSSLAAPAPAAAAILYASSYSGAITTLNLTLSGDNATQSTLQTLSSSNGCAPSPSWLTLDKPSSKLYCTDEGLTTDHGTVSSFTTGPDGKLEQLAKVDTISGPVSAVLFGEGGKGLAVAQYGGSSLSWFDISNSAAITPVKSETFTMTGPGPNPSRQEAPHPHEVFLDPKGQFVLVPDLGADLVRVFAVDGLNLVSVDPLTAAPGSGPRHVEFLVTPEGKTFLYLIAELSNTITAYDVVYRENKTLAFAEVYSGSTYGAGNTAPAGASGAEIWISPDGKFLTVSSRNDSAFSITNPDTNEGAQIPSDSLNSFSINAKTGELTLLQKFPAGGRIPRQFSVNKAGSLVAVGLQSDSRVVIISRDATSGKLGEIIASTKVEGEVTAVIFDE
ncbi:extracellular aldonolactonase [Colletotrichum plurivorum]|uniref:Extracellular aldonolactonase n=1 Tax=Colletotrichum plurivorum TaxID=2175906 RepID=A0A8H6NQS3_9PEZI|nr:extracellular aldonolactonase [Colletotrichum plurivorum]